MANRMKVSIFGSTGSIGVNTVDLLLRFGGKEIFDVQVLSAGENVKLLAEQALTLDASVVVTAFDDRLNELKTLLTGSEIKVISGKQALIDAANIKTDWTMSAIVGAAGIKVGLKSLEHGGILALANKETMVCAGELANKLAKRHKAKILPVDSEHSAIFQCLKGETVDEVETITLTASGGPFRDLSVNDLQNVTPDQAANHPNWSMGKKISIDSASLFNKGLEVIEAHQLFSLRSDQIKVVIHPESIIHALVNFKDGSTVTQMSTPDMRAAISFALNYPKRPFLNINRVNLTELGALNFEKVNFDQWPSLRMAYEVINIGGSAGVVYNAAKEEALAAFIRSDIGFLDMYKCVENVLEYLVRNKHFQDDDLTLDEIFENDELARALSHRYLKHKSI